MGGGSCTVRCAEDRNGGSNVEVWRCSEAEQETWELASAPVSCGAAPAVPSLGEMLDTASLFSQEGHDQLLALLPALLGNVGDDCTVEYKVDDDKGQCGELCLSSTIAPFAEQFGGVTKGACADIGYTVFDHKESVSMGPFGSSDVDIYVKP
ncbi:hypothetical protein TeGR_g2735 [Tetraparma gracilis]|uniref:Uncharacterized protein n=1 Tax=Tetraparma gracilis TaxID=2962635 RepID=A0ABQ6M9Q2_9STRA|nr:hypothetical protein TeGR_g2735 [Tetraparma gracilis]